MLSFPSAWPDFTNLRGEISIFYMLLRWIRLKPNRSCLPPLPPLDFLRTQTPVMMWMMATRIPSRATHSSTTTGRALPRKSFPLSSFVLPRSHHNSGVCWNTSDIFNLLIHSALAVTLAVWYQPVAHIKKSTLAQLIEGHCLWGLFCLRFFPPWFYSI